MFLSWNEIKNRAIAFSKEWENETSEDAEAKSFWDAFFNVFGVPRRRMATFEQAVKKLGNKQGFIDLFWAGKLIVEHKSKGKNLDKAFQQATEYFYGLKDYELPKYVLVSDFQYFRLYNLDENTNTQFELKDLYKNIQVFGFISGYEKRVYKDQDPVNIEAAERMGKLHDALAANGYTGHELEVYLVRLLFLLFADNTSIFEPTQFQEYIDKHTKEDGSDIDMHLSRLFAVLNTPKEKRMKTLSESLNAFPYINGKLFEEMLPFADFDKQMRDMLLYACSLDWSKISPAIFGSMFQSVMNPKERRNLGAHYTSEKNIQKVIRPLFLDELYKAFEKARGNRNRLNDLHNRIASLHFLDPACGCGNFLIVTYRELRELELDILKELNKNGQGVLDIRSIIKIDVHQFAGIEYDEFAVRITEVALWMIDHQMNMRVSEEFGQYFTRLPLQKAAKIVHGNALQTDWETVVPKEKLNFILGNPPFVGKQLQDTQQKKDMLKVFAHEQTSGVLDYVAAWYVKAAQLVKNTTIRCAFVATNSISQGEQVGILWNILFNRCKVKIHFAHRTFSWSNEAKGNAAVHCVIIGFAYVDTEDKYIYEYTDIKGEPVARKVRNINPYLIEGNDIMIDKRRAPISDVPKIVFGNMPNDGGHLLMTDVEKIDFLIKEPNAEKFIKPIVSAHEFLNNEKRWCLWLLNAEAHELRALPEVKKRIDAVKKYRAASSRAATQKLALTPAIFGEIRQPSGNYILIPRTSSENRRYIPMGFLNETIIVSDSCLSVNSTANMYHFGVLQSLMHTAWVRYVGGKMKNDLRYSNEIVYNNYPFPQNISDAQQNKIEAAAQKVLDARAAHPDSSLADLYDPLSMPMDLVKAHAALDKAVDTCYRAQPFANELSRIEFLFTLYEQLTAPMFAIETIKKTK
jgi:N-6 DNA Methylase